MKIKELHKMSFEDALNELENEIDTITSYEVLKDYIKLKIDEDNILLALHLLKAIWEDTSTGDTNYYDYDYTCGTCNTPTPINCIEDLEQYCED